MGVRGNVTVVIVSVVTEAIWASLEIGRIHGSFVTESEYRKLTAQFAKDAKRCVSERE